MKHNKYFAILLLVSILLTSCNTGDITTETNESDELINATDEQTVELVTERPYLDDIPADLDFGGTTVNLFMRDNSPMPEFDVKDDSADIVDSAIFRRNSSVSERLGVKFNHIGYPCAWADIPYFTAQVENSVLADDGAYDIIGTYSIALVNLAVADMLYDISDTKYIDFDQPWWSQLYTEKSYVGDRLYFASGDISVNMMYCTYAYFFNKDMLIRYNLEEPYELAENGKWTLDKYFEMSEGVYIDLNNDGKKDIDDQYGSTICPTYSDSLYWGSGLTMLEKAENGDIVLSNDLKSERVVDLLPKVLDAYVISQDHYLYGGDVINFFHNGNVMFAIDEMQYPITHLRDSSFDYGVLPTPKYDEAQERYYTTIGAAVYMYGMPITIKNPDMASAVMEALASESYENVTPVLFEKAMKVKYARDEASARMFDIIRESRTTDYARLFTESLEGIINVFRTQILEKNYHWASNYERKLTKYQQALDVFNSEFVHQ